MARRRCLRKLVGGLGRKLKLGGGESAVVTFVVTWNFPNMGSLEGRGHGRYYATKFASAQAVADHLAENYDEPLCADQALARHLV